MLTLGYVNQRLRREPRAGVPTSVGARYQSVLGKATTPALLVSLAGVAMIIGVAIDMPADQPTATRLKPMTSALGLKALIAASTVLVSSSAKNWLSRQRS